MANRSKTIVRALAIALAACAWSASADATITATLIPSPPVFQQPLAVRLADTQGPHCWPATASIMRDGNVITLSLSFTDSCNKSSVLPYRDYALGTLTQGSYVLIYRSCANNPPPLPSTCNTVLQLPFTITVPVPAASAWSILALIAGIFSISAGIWLSRRKRS